MSRTPRSQHTMWQELLPRGGCYAGPHRADSKTNQPTCWLELQICTIPDTFGKELDTALRESEKLLHHRGQRIGVTRTSTPA